MAIHMNMARRGLVLAGAAALISWSPSADQPIAPQLVSQTPTTAPATQPIGAHWIQDQRLRAVMAQLSSRNPNWPAGIPQEPEAPGQGEPAQFAEVALLAGALESAADKLPEVAAGIKMGEA